MSEIYFDKGCIFYIIHAVKMSMTITAKKHILPFNVASAEDRLSNQ